MGAEILSQHFPDKMKMKLVGAERWPSGGRRAPRKRVYLYGYRGFESLSLRHFTCLVYFRGGGLCTRQILCKGGGNESRSIRYGVAGRWDSHSERWGDV